MPKKVSPSKNSEDIHDHLGWVLALMLVAGTAFVLGGYYRSEVTEEVTTKSPAVASESVAPENPVITEISQAATVEPLASNEEVEAELEPAETVLTGIININTASLADLETLPGIGPSKAQAIISHRQANGPFLRVDDLINVKGIGPKTLESLRNLVTI